MKKLLFAVICVLLVAPAYGKNEGNPGKNKGLPPGLEKKLKRTGELPPGWEKKLVKGGYLDDDLYSYCRPFDKSDKYPGHPEYRFENGTELLQIQNRIIRIKRDTREILDILGVNLD